MKSSYKKLWKLLIDKDMNKTDLRKATGLSTFTVAKMTRGDDVNLSILKRTSNACVQVMLFRDRLEIINPGPLPRGLTVEDLYRAHDSIPRNRLIAQAMSWTSYVEKSGSGTGSIVDKCVEQGLARPDFEPTVGFFRTIVWRNNTQSGPSHGTKSAPSRHSVTGAQSRGVMAGAATSMNK